MGLKWFPWGSFCPSTSNRPELHQFRPFFGGNVWIHLPCFQRSGIELLSLKGLKFLYMFWTSWHFLSNIWHPIWVSKRASVTWRVWNGFHGVHSAHQRPIDQNYTNLDLSFGETFEFTYLVSSILALNFFLWKGWSFFFLNFMALFKRYFAP